MGLDQHQKAAVAAVCQLPSGILRIPAAAGSGKTRTAVAAVASALRQGVAPQETLVLTFSRAAAAELAHRFTALGWGKGALPEIGTYHRLARRALGGTAWPMTRCLEVGGAGQQVPTLDAILERIMDTGRVFPTTLAGLGLQAQLDKLGLKASAYGTVIGALRGYGCTPDDWTAAGALARATAQALPGVREVWRRLDEVKRAVGGWDFEDLLEAWERRLRQNGGGGYRLVVVDEAQDNTPRQNIISTALVRDPASGTFGTVVRVGDPNQAIYAFRGSSPEHFDAPVGAVPLLPPARLPTNYRSGRAIVDAGNAVLNAQAAPAPAAEEGALWGLLAAWPAQGPDVLAEALRRRPPEEWPEWAILCRTNAQTYRVATALVVAGVAARGFGGLPPQVLTVASYLQILHPPAKGTPALAWKLAAQRPNRWFSRRTLDMLTEALHPTRLAGLTWEQVCEKILAAGRFADQEGKARASSQGRAAELFVGDLTTLRGYTGLAAQGRAILTRCYPTWDRDEADEGGGGASGLDDADERSGWRLAYNLLEGAVDEVTAAYKAGELGELDRGALRAEALRRYRGRLRLLAEPSDTGVFVGTIHGAKGLEWPRVAVLATRGDLPRDPPPTLTGPASRAAYADEERRLLYVGVTRAKRELLVVGSEKSGRKPVKSNPQDPEGGRVVRRLAHRGVLDYLRDAGQNFPAKGVDPQAPAG